MMAVFLAALTLAPGLARANAGPHGAIASCRSAAQPNLDQRAARSLWAPIAWHRSWKVGGFSECLFVSKKGTFVLLDLASSQMLSRHFGHRVSAGQEYARIDRQNGFPRQLQYIGRDHTQFLVLGKWAVALQDDVVGVVTFGFFHKVNGHAAHFPKAFRRLSNFIYYVMAGF